MSGILPAAIQTAAPAPASSAFPWNLLSGCSERRGRKRKKKKKTQRIGDFTSENLNFHPSVHQEAFGGEARATGHVFLLKHFPAPTSREGLSNFPIGVQSCNPAPTGLGPPTFPSDTGISPTEELLCEIRRFLMSRHLSPLLTYVHPAINRFGTSVTPLIT